MIKFNTKPGFFQSWPIHGWDGLKPRRDRCKHVKMIVDVTYDKEEDEKVNAIVKAFQSLFNGEEVIGPDGHPMKLGKFANFIGQPIKAGQPNANGDIYPEDEMARVVAALPGGPTPVSVSFGEVKMNRQTLRTLFWVGVGAAGMLVLELLALLATWKDIVDWIVFHY